MKLTKYEEVTLMKQAINIHGITFVELKKLLNSKNKSESNKADAIAQTFSRLKSMQVGKKTEARSDKQSKTLAKALSTKLSPVEEFIAQSKRPDQVKKSSWVKSVFEYGKVSDTQAIALLSQSCMSSMQELDPYQVERVRLHNDEVTKRVALGFCKRFGLIAK